MKLSTNESAVMKEPNQYEQSLDISSLKDTQITLITAEEKSPMKGLQEKMKKFCVEVILVFLATFTVSFILFYHFETWINRTVRNQQTGLETLVKINIFIFYKDS